jgi:hypothetical protein
MSSGYKIRDGVFAVAFAVGCAAPAFAGAMPPQPIHQGQASYITGGIGEDEQQAIEASARDYNLLISNAEKDGEFTAGTDFTITNRHGQEVLRAHDTGPLFYAQLPPGDYVIHATYNGAQRVRDVSITGKSPSDIHLIWPDIDRPLNESSRG